MAIRECFLVELLRVAAVQHLRRHPLVFRLGPVAVHKAVRLRQRRRFIHPGFQWGCHSASSAIPCIRRHKLQSASARPLLSAVTLWMKSPTGSRLWNEWTYLAGWPMQRRELPASSAGAFLVSGHSLCYPSSPVQAAAFTTHQVDLVAQILISLQTCKSSQSDTSRPAAGSRSGNSGDSPNPGSAASPGTPPRTCHTPRLAYRECSRPASSPCTSALPAPSSTLPSRARKSDPPPSPPSAVFRFLHPRRS